MARSATRTEPTTDANELRIDDLAQRAGVTVDTIRFYSREGLLPPPRRVGRHKLYGPRHVDRLARIRDLRDRRFSLAAIKAILESELPGIEELFTAGDHSYDLDELAMYAGLDVELVEQLHATGILPDPRDFGREAYDTSDLGLLEAVAELLRGGMPEEVLVALAGIYVASFEQLQRDVTKLLSGAGEVELDPDRLAELHLRLTAESGRLIPAAERVLHYVHQRTLQRLTLEKMLAPEGTAGTGPSSVH